MSRRPHRLPGRLLGLALKPVNLLLGALGDLTSRDSEAPLPRPPVFILGAPRCGSTLLYQLLAATGELGYLSNLHCLLHGAPALAHRLGRRLVHPAESRWESHYGRVRGLGAPAECGEFWYRFFRRRPQHVAAGELGDPARRRLRGALRRLIEAMDRPLLIKNLVSSVRLAPLAEALPEALFIVLRRNEVDLALSLLEGRRHLYGTYERWFSVEPPEVDELRRLPVAGQVVEQSRAIYRLIEGQRREIGGARFVSLSYEDLCRDTHGALDTLSGFLAAHDVALGSLDGLPRSFPRRSRQADPGLLAAVERYAARSEPHPPAATTERSSA